MTIITFSLIAGFVHLFLGFLWYSFIFQNAWMRYMNLTDADTTKGLVMISQLLGTFVLGVLYGIGFWYLLSVSSDPYITTLGVLGLIITPALTGSMIWYKFRIGFWALEVGYRAVFALIITFIYTLI